MLVDMAADRLAVRSGYSARELMKSIPGSRWDKDTARWTLPLSLGSALALGWAAAQLKEKVEPTSAEVVDWVQAQQAEWETLTGEAKRLIAAEKVPGWFGHQVQGAKWLAMPGGWGGRLDCGQTGSGKTATSLRGMWHLWCEGETGPALVSTVLSVKSGWASEVERVKASLPLPEGAEWRTVVLSGTAVKRRKLFGYVKDEVDAGRGVGLVVICNHEQLRTHSRLSGYGDIALARCPRHGGVREGDGVVTEARCEAHPKELNGLPWAVVVFDEVHRLMVPQAKQTRAAWAVRNTAKRGWGLTGTPGSRSIIENTWALLRCVVGEQWPSKSSWTGYYAQVGHNSQGFWEIGGLRPEHEAEFRALHDGLARRVLKAQVLDLPPLLRGGTLVREVEMGAAQAAAYQEMRDTLRVQTEEGLLSAQNALVQIGRLTGLASATGLPGKTWIDDEGVEHLEMVLADPSNKADAVVDMIKSGDVEAGTVFQFVSRKLLYLVRDAMVKAGVRLQDIGIIAGDVPEAERDRMKALFQEGKIPWFMFTTGAGGTGITLTRADTMVAVQRPWSSIQHIQAQDRIHRIGSERHEAVTVYDLISPGTVEFDQLARLDENAEALESVVKDRDKLLALLGG